MLAVEALQRFVAGLTPEGRAELDALIEPELAKLWLPDPENGPQLEAYLSPADLLLYGGAAGGGKTDLLIGCAVGSIEAVIFRRQYKDLQGIEDRLIQITGAVGYNRGPPKVWRAPGHKLELDHLGEPGSELSHQGRPRDFIGFDEGAQLTPYRVKFVMGWLRSAAGKRCRAVIATNPPSGGEGAWLIEWFAPWLDPLYPRPAKHGELRWCIVVGGADDIRTMWVPGPGHWTKDGAPWTVGEEDYEALSRTYIPARLDDNRFLRDTPYRAQINAMPEPLRSQLLHGDFLAGRTDDPWQVIPSEWIRSAQARWIANREKPLPTMLHMGVDVAQGGADTTVVSPLRGVRFDPLIEVPGKETPNPIEVVQLVIGARRNDAGITIDCTGGWGIGVRSHLRTHNEIEAYAFVASAKTGARTPDMKMGYLNDRSESWWGFRLALDPQNEDKIELPPDTKLAAQLAAPRWKLRGDLIVIEAKDELRKRLGTSTDRADACIMAWFDRKKSILRRSVKKMGAQGVPEADPLAMYR